MVIFVEFIPGNVCINFWFIVDINCPECNSSYVVEIKEPSPPKPCKNQQSLEKCESHSSIGKLFCFYHNTEVTHVLDSFFFEYFRLDLNNHVE